jgi:pimeloyl-ACP methyl ester carboxylesterase
VGGRRLPAGRHRPRAPGKARPPLSEYHRFVRVGGLKVRYEDFGQGPPVLLLHGIGHSLRNWSRTVPALVEAGFRAISIDTPGFGYSERPSELLAQAAVTAFLDEFLDTFYLDQVNLVGHSLGGSLATVYALDRPQRVIRLALVAAAVGPDVNPALRLLALRVARPLLRPLALRQVFGLLAGSWDDEILQSELRDAERWLSDPAAREYFWNVLRLGVALRGMKPEWLLLERLRDLKMPVMVAWGRKDRLLPFSNVEKIRSRLPDARYELYDNAGHMLPYEVAEPFNSALIDFLGGG